MKAHLRTSLLLALAASLAPLAALLAPLAAAGDAGAPVPLAWRYAKGDRLRYRMTQEQIQRVSGAESATTLQRQTIVFTQSVTAVDAAGAASITAVYEAVKVDMDRSRGGGKLAWDSTRPEDMTGEIHPAVRPMKALVGLAVSYRISRAGVVSDVTGFEKALDEALAPLAGNPAVASAAEQLRRSFGNDAMKRQLEAAFRVVPPTPTAIGGAWTSAHEQDVPALGTIRFDQRYVLAALETLEGEERARITVQSTVTRTAAASGPNPLLSAVRITLEDGSSEGETWFSPARGLLVRTSIMTSMDMRLRMVAKHKHDDGSEAEDDEHAREVRQHVDQRTSLELIPLEGPPY